MLCAMVILSRTRCALSIALAAVGLAACAQTAPELESRRISRDLESLIGTAPCSADSQCRTVPVGAKACGGPSAYLAWSTLNANADQVAALAAQQSRASRVEAEAGGLRSNCAITADPGTACVAGRCQLKPSPTPTAR